MDGPPAPASRTYTRLKAYVDSIKGQLFDVDALRKPIDDIYRYPLRPSAVDTLNRQLRSGVSDDQLAEIVMSMREEDRLCLANGVAQTQEPQIICSLGLFDTENDSVQRATCDSNGHTLAITTVATGNETSWSRSEIYDDDGR